MTNSKTTKRALFSSVVALLLCFTMLLGTTFAWFTDSATSGNNIIKTGNLDMKLSWRPYGADHAEEWAEVTESTVLFGKDALYEPGYTEAVWLKVENLGSLAFRYDLAINVASEKQGTNKAGEKFSLSDHLEVKYMTTTSTDMESGFYTTRESLDSFAFGSAANSGVASLADDIAVIKNGVAFSANDATNGAYSSAYVLVVISMPTTVGNEANHNGTDIPQIDFSLTALATQLAYESDSFGSDYDVNAEYPKLGVSTADELISALSGATGDVEVKLANDIDLGACTSTILNANVTYNIDLNGYTLSAQDQAFNLYSGVMNISNGTIDRTNTADTSGRFITVGSHAGAGHDEHGDGCETIDRATLNLTNVSLVSEVASKTSGGTAGQIIHVLCQGEVNLYNSSFKIMMSNGVPANHIDVYNRSRNTAVNVYAGCSFYGDPTKQYFKNEVNYDWVEVSGQIKFVTIEAGYKLEAAPIADGDTYAWYTVVAAE